MGTGGRLLRKEGVGGKGGLRRGQLVDVVMVIQVVVRRQQVTDSQAISVLHSHVRTQTVTTQTDRQTVPLMSTRCCCGSTVTVLR